MIRRIDDLGRITLPAELRRRLLINAGDCIVITISQETILLNKFQQTFDLIRSIEDLEKIVQLTAENLKWWEYAECDYIHDLLKHLEGAKRIARKLRNP